MKNALYKAGTPVNADAVTLSEAIYPTTIPNLHSKYFLLHATDYTYCFKPDYY